MTIDDLADIIVEFVQSATAADGRAVLLHHPELLGPEVDDLFDSLIEAAAYERNTRVIRALAVIHPIIVSGRRIGLAAATMDMLKYDRKLRADVDEARPVDGVREGVMLGRT